MKFPKEAEPVRQYIIKNVGRPKTLPQSRYIDHLRFIKNELKVCPLGLLPLAVRRNPIDKAEMGLSIHSPILRNKDIEIFWTWWDAQTDPQYAVDTVWNKDE